MKSSTADLHTLIDYGKLFYERRWMWGTSGNLSIRLSSQPLKIAITAGGVNKGYLKTSDLLTIEDGKPTPKHPQGLVPSSETLIHQALYHALPGAGAVFHVHPMYATLISSFYGHPKERRPLHVEWFETMKTIGVGDEESADLSIFPNWQDGSRIAQDLTDYIQSSPKALPVALIYNHGLTVWGSTPEHARNSLEAVEYVCEYLYLKRLAKCG